MTWLDPVTAKAAYDVYKALIDNEETQQRLKRLMDWVITGQTQIAVVGAGGTGKSTFEHVVTAENPIFAKTTYRSDWTTQAVSLPGSVSARLLVAPGQQRYVDTEWEAIFEKLQAARSVALINVVSYGYHAFNFDSFKDTESYENGQSVAEWKAAHTDTWRGREIERLKDVQAALLEVNKPVWMLTVVSKQDLWWNDKPSVQRHYTDPTTSAYAQIVAEIEQGFADRGVGFSHHALGVSQVHENFATKDDGVVIPVCEGYSLSEHLNSLYNLIDRFRELLEAGAPPKQGK